MILDVHYPGIEMIDRVLIDRVLIFQVVKYL